MHVACRHLFEQLIGDIDRSTSSFNYVEGIDIETFRYIVLDLHAK